MLLFCFSLKSANCTRGLLKFIRLKVEINFGDNPLNSGKTLMADYFPKKRICRSSFPEILCNFPGLVTVQNKKEECISHAHFVDNKVKSAYQGVRNVRFSKNLARFVFL